MNIRIVGVVATQGNPCVFSILEGEQLANRMRVYSSEFTVISTLLMLFKLGAIINCELYDGSGQVKRVNPISCPESDSSLNSEGRYYIDRIATQVTSMSMDHLEVFLKNAKSDEVVQYNVFDLNIQQVILYFFSSLSKSKTMIDISPNETDKTITSIMVGSCI